MDAIKNVCCQATVEEYENKIAQSSEALEKCKQFAERQMEDIKVEMIEMTKKLLEQNAVIKKIYAKNKRLKEKNTMLIEKYKLLEHKLEDKENVKTNGATAHTAATTTTKTTISNDEKVVIALDEFKKSFAQSSEVSPTGGITLEDYDKLRIKEKMSKFSKITKAANGTTYTLYLAGKVWLDAHKEGKKLGDKLNEARRFDKKHKRQTAVTMKNNFNKTEEKAYNAYKHNKHEKFKLCTIFVFFIGF